LISPPPPPSPFPAAALAVCEWNASPSARSMACSKEAPLLLALVAEILLSLFFRCFALVGEEEVDCCILKSGLLRFGVNTAFLVGLLREGPLDGSSNGEHAADTALGPTRGVHCWSK
jgi:hypothetical protein